MTLDQAMVFGVLAATMAMFAWGRWRYDVIALLALMTVVLLGLVPAREAFHGFGHPAVVTVAAVLVISRALQVSGVVDVLVRLLAPTRRSLGLQIVASTSIGAMLSAFMNNVGALALMLPVTIRNAYRAGWSPSQVLMPLSFATLLGGLVTLIGTPPNIVIATFRDEATGAPFSMFDFTPVGLSVAVIGLLYLWAVGWRLLPHHRRAEGEADKIFRVQDYVTEALIPEGSSFEGARVRDLEQRCENEVTVMTIIRGNRRILAPGGAERLSAGDLMILQGDPAALDPLMQAGGLERSSEHEIKLEMLRSADVRLIEAVVMPNAVVEGQTMRGMRMHDRYGINLLAVARPGETPRTRLGSVRFRTGDVLLLQGDRDRLNQALTTLGCLPLADRGLKVVRRRRLLAPLGIFGGAIALAGLGLVPIQIAFVTAVLLLVVTGTLALRDIYSSIEWPVIVLLGALIPLGEALQTSGATALIAGGITALAGDLPTWSMLALMMVVSMLLSDLIHNTPTAVLMAPVAIAVAANLGFTPDPFLMAVAVGSASPYLTPIGHQSNTLVMGPGGYRFFDYARVGLGLDLLILLVAVPMIVWVWLP